MRPQYFGPLAIISHNRGGAYILTEMNGAVLTQPIGTFHVIPYFPCRMITLLSLDDMFDISTDEFHHREQSIDPDEEIAPPLEDESAED